MMRLNCEKYNPEYVIDRCIEGVTGNSVLKAGVEGAKAELLVAALQYEQRSKIGNLYTIAPIDLKAGPDPVVIGLLKKSDLVKVYEQYLVPGSKPAREIYDYLLAAALDDCPFCGGLGTPRNLDHFLPKFNFPQFAILPSNLVPSCRDCNMDAKATAFAVDAESQIIQPYTDKDCFFTEQWIFASFRPGNAEKPGVFDFIVKPPVHWEAVDKARATKHFVDFNIAGRYRSIAGKNAITILAQMDRMRDKGLSEQDIRETILDVGEATAPFVNHWKIGMYQALIAHYCPRGRVDVSCLIACPHCDDGYSSCPNCHGGRAGVTCPDCGGDGCWYDPDAGKSRQCNRCEGEGGVNADACDYCDGQGTVLCDPCQGTGLLSEDDCLTCGGSEEVTCRQCHGSSGANGEEGHSHCDKCHDSGRESCPACQ